MTAKTVPDAVTFVDVGQGHATVVKSCTGETMVVDCPGQGSADISELIGADSDISAVVVSHRDLDHCGGIPDLLRRHPVETLYINAGFAISASGREKPKVSSVLREIFDLCEAKGVTQSPMLRGDVGNLGEFTWTVLWPAYNEVTKSAQNDRSNESSVVLYLETQTKSFILSGDIEGVPAKIVAGSAPTADVLQVPHHGANGTALEELLAAVRPRWTVVSAGRSDGRHPTQETLDLLATNSARVLCTQVNKICHRAGLERAACAGNVTFSIANGRMRVLPGPTDHVLRIRALSCPACLPAP